ncbi:MAG: type VI secretion system-associated FHA domain protein TagH [Candidatus Sedimenticola sp. (ex Thyasira tokunagai)]
MKLHLKVITYRNQPPIAPISALFDEQGGSLGRTAGNNCVLPDPERFISSKHAAISFQGQRFVITDTSTNGLYLDDSGQPLGRDNSAELHNGQRLVIGDYTIEIVIDDELPAMGASPFGDSLPQAIEDDFLAPPRGEDMSLPELEGTGPTSEPFPSTPSNLFAEGAGEIGGIPESNDFFAASSAISSESSTPYPESASEADNIPSENQFFQPPQSMPESGGIPAQGGFSQSSQSIPDDWDILGDMGVTGQPSTTPPPEAAITPPPPQPQPSLSPQPAIQRTPSSTSSVDALKILLKGANMESLEVAPEESEALLETIGELMREMVGGLMEVLRARAEIKSEFRMQLTTIRPVENNPLKFSAGVDEALRNLLAPQSDAYLPPRVALNEAMDNIEAHQLAVMAGMQAALSAMLKRFEPGTLERYFENKGGRSLLGSKKSWYWEQFEEKYKEVLSEAEDNFQDLFGEEFARAYQDQTAKLVQARNLTQKDEI